MAKKLTLIGRAELGLLRPEIDAALVKLGERLGVAFKATNGTYTNGPTGSFKVEISISDGSGRDAVAIRREADWHKYVGLYADLKPEWLGEGFSYAGKMFKIVGLDPNRRTKPVVLDLDGVTKIAPVEMVRNAMLAKTVRRAK